MANTAANTRPILDHIVILVPYDTLFELPKRLENVLTVIDGGKHAGGLTVNKLVILPDGTYLELIAFNKNITQDQRHSARWGKLEEGRVIDWAYTLPDEADFKHVQQRVQEGSNDITYTDPQAGGRTRPDSTVLKWAVAWTKDKAGDNGWPGDAPFWCLDRTPRHLRVPYKDENGLLLAHTSHPSKAHGVSKLSVLVSEKDQSTFKPVYDAIHKTGQAEDSTDQGWKYNVHSGSNQGSHRVSLSVLEDKEAKSEIRFTFLGTNESPKSIEILPGLTVDFDIA